MRSLIFAAVLVASPAMAQDADCANARNLSANYWTMTGALVAILENCEGERTAACRIARKADEAIKEQGTPNGTAWLMMQKLSLCSNG